MTTVSVQARHARRPEPIPASPRLPVSLSPGLLVSRSSQTGFILFLLVNATLFIRPAEISTSLAGWPIYEVLILLCLVFSYPAVLRQLTWKSLKQNPVTICVLGLLPAIMLSHLRHGDIWDARMGALEFAKTLIYYFLLVGLVDSPRRLRTFLLTITSLVAFTALICVLNYHEIIQVPALEVIKQQQYDEADSGAIVLRLQALGIFSDPNDFSLVLVTSMLVIAHAILAYKAALIRLSLLPPFVLLGYAFTLTRSRGGLLALVAGFGMLAVLRWGWRRSLPVLLVIGPVFLLLFGGRQTNITLDRNDTGMGRILLWRDALVEWHQTPTFGIGFGKLPDAIGLVAHNSYVHSFAELGLVGGTCFVGIIYLLVYGITKANAEGTMKDAQVLLAIVAGYAAGLFSLSRVYSVSTYAIVGAGAAFLAMAARSGVPIVPVRPIKSIVIASISTIVFLEFFVRIVARGQ
jgi:putative inorganic carbon (hco3(-)) transporter